MSDFPRCMINRHYRRSFMSCIRPRIWTSTSLFLSSNESDFVKIHLVPLTCKRLRIRAKESVYLKPELTYECNIIFSGLMLRGMNKYLLPTQSDYLATEYFRVFTLMVLDQDRIWHLPCSEKLAEQTKPWGSLTFPQFMMSNKNSK